MSAPSRTGIDPSQARLISNICQKVEREPGTTTPRMRTHHSFETPTTDLLILCHIPSSCLTVPNARLTIFDRLDSPDLPCDGAAMYRSRHIRAQLMMTISSSALLVKPVSVVTDQESSDDAGGRGQQVSSHMMNT
jgi:hypothetical protein